jgi:hypothetical protein
MDKKIENFSNELNKIKVSHPNLYKLWKTYLDSKIKLLNETIDNGLNMLDSAKNINDFTPEQIMTLYNIKNHFYQK